jgi:DNA-binding transcriptional LysR family regulator
MRATAAPDVSGQTLPPGDTRVERHRSAAAAPADQAGPERRAKWPSIEVRHLAALAAVAQEGSFRRAGEQLGYVQSAISGQIAHLEQAVGTRLLERASGTPIVSLTVAGQLLLRHTEEILARFETAYADVNSLTTRTAGVVRVAGLENFAPRQVAGILSLFRQRHPFARVLMDEDALGNTAPARLRDGTLDLLVYEPPAVQDSLTQVVLRQDEYVLLASADSELIAGGTPLAAAELASLHPIVPGACAASGALSRQLARLGVDPDPRLAPESVATAQALVASGLGTALAPSGLVDHVGAATRTIDLSHLLAPHTIVLGMAPERASSATVDGFARVIQELCADRAPSASQSRPALGCGRCPHPQAA